MLILMVEAFLYKHPKYYTAAMLLMYIDVYYSKISLALDNSGLRIGCRFSYPHQYCRTYVGLKILFQKRDPESICDI
jgi:hypothetical protein